MKKDLKPTKMLLLLFFLIIGSPANAQKKTELFNPKMIKLNPNLKKPLKPIPFLNYRLKQKKEEATTTPLTDCPGTTVTCTVTRASLESPIFGSSLFTIPRDLFVGNLFDVDAYKNSGVMDPKVMGVRNKVTVSAFTQSVGGTNPVDIDPTQAQYMSFLTSARSQLDLLIGDNRPIESAEYNIENITSKDHMKATLGLNYSDPQSYFNFSASASNTSSKQYAVLKFIEKSFDVSMDTPSGGLTVSPTTIPSNYGFVSNISYGRFVLLIFETSRNDFDLKSTLEGGLNVPGASGGASASAEFSSVQSTIKVRLIIQGFNANSSYGSLLSGASLNNQIVEKINDIIGGAIGTRTAAIPIMITAKKATLIDNAYPEITQSVTFNNVPVDKECVTNYPPSAKTYKYEVSFNKIYSTKAAWSGNEQLYGALRCYRNTASKGDDVKRDPYTLADLSKPNQVEIQKEKEYNLSTLINGLKPLTVTFTKPECITEEEFLRRSFLDLTAPLKIVRSPLADEYFNAATRHKKHFLNEITNSVGPYNNFGNSCNSSNKGIICTTTPDGQNFQISYTIKKVN